MSDLRSRLHDVVDVGDAHGPRPARGATASDDVLVGVLTARVRRRRGLRGAATGALSVLTVAAVAASGYALAGRGGTPAPATDPATDPPTGPASLACGDAVDVDALRPVADGLRFEMLELGPGPVVVGDLLAIEAGIWNDAAPALADLTVAPAVRVAALRAGTVVATGSVRFGTGSFAQGTRWGSSDEVRLEPCDDASDDLGAGDYELVAVATLSPEGGGGARTVLSLGPVPFTVVDEDDEVRMPAEALVCGEPLPAELPSDPALGVAVDVGATVPAGERLPWTVRWWSTSGATPNLLVADVQVATVRDGVVVGSSLVAVTYDDARQPLPTAESSALELSDAAEPVRCGTFLPLPPGEYETVLVLTLVTAEREVLRTTAPTQPLTITRARPRALACGDVAPEDATVAPPEAPVYVNGAVQPGAVTDLTAPVAAHVANDSDQDLSWPHATADLAVTRGGIVVATATADLLPDAAPAGLAVPGPVVDVTLVPCHGRALEPGRHEMWLHAVLHVTGTGPVEILDGPWSLTVD